MRFATILALIVGVAVCTGASAQDYPARPIKLIVPYSAGGPADVVARVIGQRMSAILVVNPNLPIHSVRELIAYAKANPGKLSYSSPGVGTPPHMIGEMLKLKTGIGMVHVPYKGGGNSTQDVIGGQVQLTFENPAVSLPLARSGSIRALAVTSSVRNPQIPELPTMIEAGVPDFVSVSFTGLVAPAGTPEAIIRKLNAAANESLKDAAVQSVLQKLAV